jgi:hypothetical protein
MRFLIAMALALSASLGSAQNAFLTNCFVPRYWKANQGWEIAARVRNSVSGSPLITFRVDYRYNNGPVQQGNWQSTTGINPGQYWPYVHQTPFTSPAADGVLKVWVVGNGDADPTNDTLYFPVTVLPQWSTKRVLIEQFTGTWCQFCPSPNAATNTLDADPFIVVAKHHNADELSSASSTAYWSQFNANYSPAGVMEQEEFGTLPDDAAYDQWGPRAELRKQGVSPVAVSISSAFNIGTRLLAVDVSAAFSAAVSGSFVLNAYVVEDQVPGPQTAAAPGYLHQQVVREVLGGPNGVAGIIPATTAAGATYTEQFALTVPAEWNHANLRVIATVTERRSSGSWTMNVADAAPTVVGVEEHAGLRVSAYPNPSCERVWLRLAEDGPVRIELIAADGRLVRLHHTQAVAGMVQLDGLDALPAGLYTARVQQGQRSGAVRIALER